MNGKVAKKLRKKLDYKPFAKRRYSHIGGTITNIGKRKEYQDAKKDFIKGL